MSKRTVAVAIPVILVNAVAFTGQLGYWLQILATVLAFLVAGTLESIAIYLAYQAHLSQLADDSALRLRLGAYGIALVIGALNYSHWCGPHWRPTPAAVAFALCSVLSPWLWSIHSRRESRDRLLATGKIEKHALRLGATRWAWHPIRSAQVMWMATWKGTTNPRKAIRKWEEVHPEPEPQVHPAAASAPALPARAATAPRAVSGSAPVPAIASALSGAPTSAAAGAPRNRGRRHGRRGTQTHVTYTEAEVHFADMLAAGKWPGLQPIKTELHVGQDRAKEIRDHLKALVEAQQQAAA